MDVNSLLPGSGRVGTWSRFWSWFISRGFLNINDSVRALQLLQREPRTRLVRVGALEAVENEKKRPIGGKARTAIVPKSFLDRSVYWNSNIYCPVKVLHRA